MTAPPTPLAALDPPDLQRLIARLPDVRTQRLDIPGLGRFWLKRAEHLPLRMRLQKGDPRAALERERKGLRVLGGMGLPVPEVAAEGPDFLLLPDSGPNLADLLARPDLSSETRQAAFAAAGRALANLHCAGFAHGRPLLRDICWDGSTARLIDLERFSLHRIRPRHMALDIVIFVQGWFTHTPRTGAELTALLDAYRAKAVPGAWHRVVMLARRLRWMAPVARALSRLRPQSRELAAVPLTIAHLAS